MDNKRSVSLLPFYDAVGTDATLFPSGERPQQQSSSSTTTTRARAFFNVVLSSSFQSRTNEKIVVCFVNTCAKKKERKKIIVFLSRFYSTLQSIFATLKDSSLVGIETWCCGVGVGVFWCFLTKIKK